MRFQNFVKILCLSVYLFPSLSLEMDYQSIHSWVGKNESSLTEKWGIPDIKIQKENGGSQLIYKKVNTQTHTMQTSPSIGVNVSPTGNPIIISTPNPNPTWNSQTLSLTCTIEFSVNRSGIITSAQMTGNGCDSRYLAP